MKIKKLSKDFQEKNKLKTQRTLRTQFKIKDKESFQHAALEETMVHLINI